MRTSIYILAFLLPLQGALAVCPDTLTSETLKQVQDRLEGKATGPISIGSSHYIVVQQDTKYAHDIMASQKKFTVEKDDFSVEKHIHEPEGRICRYTLKSNIVEGKIILVEE